MNFMHEDVVIHVAVPGCYKPAADAAICSAVTMYCHNTGFRRHLGE
jgi:hypothetical protein